MRALLTLLLILAASPALAQFPPPGVYACADAHGVTLGTLSLLVAGDYQWQRPDGQSGAGQIASASTDVTALTGPLADQHWRGGFSAEAGVTTFVFDTDGGKVTCR